MKKFLLSVAALFMVAGMAQAQVAIRSNLLSLPGGALTVGTEFALGQKWTLGIDAMGNFVNPWNFYELKGGELMLEGRYYFCEAFNKHHIGVYAKGGYYDKMTLSNEFISKMVAGCKNSPHLPDGVHDSWNWVAGISYGYYLKLNHGWGLDFTIGGGVSMVQYKEKGENERLLTNLHYGLSRLAIDLSYKF